MKYHKFTRFAGAIPLICCLLALSVFTMPSAWAAGVRLQGLDRTTARTSTVEIKTGDSAFFGRLEITLRFCKKSEPTEPLENTAFLEIHEYPLTKRATIAQMLQEARNKETAQGLSQEEQDINHSERLKIVLEEYGAEILEQEFEPMRIFSGWMLSSSPSLNALEHPVYDIWVLNCTADENS